MKHLIQRPVITEKTLLLASRGWYTFAVGKLARKPEVADAIEKQYSVNVVDIRSIAMHGKKRRVGRRMTYIARPDWKKMLVQLKAGQKIDAFEVTAPPQEQPVKEEQVKPVKAGSKSSGK